jgi:hypothetical protein
MLRAETGYDVRVQDAPHALLRLGGGAPLCVNFEPPLRVFGYRRSVWTAIGPLLDFGNQAGLELLGSPLGVRIPGG